MHIASSLQVQKRLPLVGVWGFVGTVLWRYRGVVRAVQPQYVIFALFWVGVVSTGGGTRPLLLSGEDAQS